jgi:hypothetical protein
MMRYEYHHHILKMKEMMRYEYHHHILKMTIGREANILAVQFIGLGNVRN